MEKLTKLLIQKYCIHTELLLNFFNICILQSQFYMNMIHIGSLIICDGEGLLIQRVVSFVENTQ